MHFHIRRILLPAALLLCLLACGRKPSDYVAAGEKAAQQGNTAEAILNFRKALQQDSNHGEAHYQLALLAMGSGDGDEALEQMAQAARLLPEREDVQVAFADLNLELLRRVPRGTRFSAQVQSIATALLARDPNSFHGLRLAGILLLLDNNWTGAIDRFTKANAARALDPLIVVPWIDALQLSGDTSAAASLGLRALDKHPQARVLYDALYLLYTNTQRPADAEAILRRKIEALPSDPGPVLQLAALYNQQARLEPMRATLDRLLQRDKFPDGWGQVADFYLARGDRQEADRVLEQGIRSGASELPLRRRQASLLLADGRLDQADAAIQAALAKNPADRQLRALRATIAVERDRPEDRPAVTRQLQELVALGGKDPVIPFTLARVLGASGDFASARAALGESLKRDPSFVPARFLLASNYAAAGRLGEALQATEGLLELQPGARPAELLRVELLTRLKRFPEARSALNPLLRAGEDESQVLQLLGNLHLASGDAAAAGPVFARIAATKGGEISGLRGQVEALLALQQPAAALRLIQSAAARRPEAPELRNLLGATAMQTGQPALAIEVFSALAQQFPKAVEVKLALAQAHQILGQSAAARQILEQARQLAPADPRLLAQLGDVCAAEGNLAEALALYREVAARRPDDALVLNNIAYALAETNGDLNDALAKANKAVQLAPDQLSYIETLGLVYLKKSMTSAALQTFRTLVSKAPRRAEYRFHLALALEQSGNATEAAAELRSALDHQPGPATTAKIRARLEQLSGKKL